MISHRGYHLTQHALMSLTCALGIAAATAGACAQEAPDALVEAGRRIYEQGVLVSGAPLTGTRGNGLVSKGRQAACIGCHQRSGFGRGEGRNFVPPITAQALFAKERAPIEEPRTAASIRIVQPAHLTRPAYEDSTLAVALRDGIGAGGQQFQILMPRFDLSDADMRALTAYLRALSAVPSPGSDGEKLRFATIIAPGQNAGRRQQMLDVLDNCFKDRGSDAVARAPWTLDTWDLTGAPETWQPQLKAHLARAPVFAVISGLGDAEWAPVHAFCNAQGLPCLFPNVDAPGGATEGGTTFYLSKGVVLEAEAAVRHLVDGEGEARPKRIVQMLGATATAHKAGAALAEAAKRQGLAVETRTLAEGAGRNLAQLGKSDALVLWLRAEEVAQLSRAPVPPAGTILASGWMAGFENAPFSNAWKRKALLIFPVDAPVRRSLRVRYNLEPWLQRMGLEAGDTLLQGNTLAACKVMTESLWRMRGRYHRDYLVEWIENYPGAMGNAPAPQAYPRFVISPGQRVSSHGVFIARFKKQNPREVDLARDWFVP